jgi:hypothetical protein
LLSASLPSQLLRAQRLHPQLLRDATIALCKLVSATFPPDQPLRAQACSLQLLLGQPFEQINLCARNGAPHLFEFT